MMSREDEWTRLIRIDTGYHTIPLIFESDGPWENIATGVLVRIDGLSFVFTAGHCVEAIRNFAHTRTMPKDWGKSVPVRMNVPVAMHDLREDVAGRKGPDAGWVLLSADDVNRLEAQSKTFLPLRKVRIEPHNRFPLGNSHFGISGYPKDRFKFDNGRMEVHRCTFAFPMSQELIEETTVEGADPSLSLFYWKIGVPTEHGFHLDDDVDPIGSRPRLNGMSGSGLWAWQGTQDEGSPAYGGLELLGTFCHHLPDGILIKDDVRSSFAASRVCWHIKSLRDHFPELRNSIDLLFPRLDEIAKPTR